MKMSVPPKYRNRDNYSMAEGILLLLHIQKTKCWHLSLPFVGWNCQWWLRWIDWGWRKSQKWWRWQRKCTCRGLTHSLADLQPTQRKKECLRATHVLQEDNKDVRLCQDSVRSLSQRLKSTLHHENPQHYTWCPSILWMLPGNKMKTYFKLSIFF